jgi:hypothetical protein
VGLVFDHLFEGLIEFLHSVFHGCERGDSARGRLALSVWPNHRFVAALFVQGVKAELSVLGAEEHFKG